MSETFCCACMIFCNWRGDGQIGELGLQSDPYSLSDPHILASQLQRALDLPVLLADPDVELAAILLNAEPGDKARGNGVLQEYLDRVKDLGMHVLGRGEQGVAARVWEIPA